MHSYIWSCLFTPYLWERNVVAIPERKRQEFFPFSELCRLPVIDFHCSCPFTQSLAGSGGVLDFIRVKVWVVHVLAADLLHDCNRNIVLKKYNIKTLFHLCFYFLLSYFHHSSKSFHLNPHTDKSFSYFPKWLFPEHYNGVRSGMVLLTDMGGYSVSAVQKHRHKCIKFQNFVQDAENFPPCCQIFVINFKAVSCIQTLTRLSTTRQKYPLLSFCWWIKPAFWSRNF